MRHLRKKIERNLRFILHVELTKIFHIFLRKQQLYNPEVINELFPVT